MQLPSRRAQPPLATRAAGRRDEGGDGTRGETAPRGGCRRWWEGEGEVEGTTFEGVRYLPTPGEMAIECI